jgi:cell division protein FtsL
VLRLNITLALVLVACALAVVSARHEARKSFIALQSEEKRTRDLEIEWGRLQLEQSTWAMHGRIEQVAGKHLGMAHPAVERIRVVSARQAQP